MDYKICEVNFPTTLGKCDIIIPESDSDIPYFELKGKSHSIKIKLYHAEYFGDNDYKLNQEEKEVITKRLHDNLVLAPDILGSLEQSNWEWMGIIWDQNENSNYKEKDTVLSKDIIPNYLELE